MNLHFQEGHMTCILTTLYGFPCIEKQKKPEYGILTILPFSVTKLTCISRNGKSLKTNFVINSNINWKLKVVIQTLGKSSHKTGIPLRTLITKKEIYNQLACTIQIDVKFLPKSEGKMLKVTFLKNFIF